MSVDFLATSLIVVVVPGTGVVYTLSNALAAGRRRGAVAAVGCTLGIVPHLLAALLGLAGVMQAGAAAFEVVRYAGVAYLVWMGIGMIRHGGELQVDGFDGTAGPTRKVVVRGILINLLNPKLTVFFFAFLPQFLDSPPEFLDTRLIGLALVFMAMTLLVFVVYAVAAAAIRDSVLRSQAAQRWIQGVLGALLIAFAIRLAVTAA